MEWDEKWFWWEHCNEFWHFGRKVVTKTASFGQAGNEFASDQRRHFGPLHFMSLFHSKLLEHFFLSFYVIFFQVQTLLLNTLSSPSLLFLFQNPPRFL